MAEGHLRVLLTSASGRTAVLIGEEELIRLQQHTAASGASPTLTDRERDALQCVERGMTTSEVARALGVALGTATAHLASARRKYGVHTSAQAAARARAACALD